MLELGFPGIPSPLVFIHDFPGFPRLEWTFYSLVKEITWVLNLAESDFTDRGWTGVCNSGSKNCHRFWGSVIGTLTFNWPLTFWWKQIRKCLTSQILFSLTLHLPCDCQNLCTIQVQAWESTKPITFAESKLFAVT